MNKLFLFKEINGVRKSVTLAIDENRTIKEEIIQDIPDPLIQIRKGIDYKKDGNNVTITGISGEARRRLEFFVDTIPCWFEGCEELRKQYKEEKEKQTADGCSDCEAGQLVQKYMDILMKTPGV